MRNILLAAAIAGFALASPGLVTAGSDVNLNLGVNIGKPAPPPPPPSVVVVKQETVVVKGDNGKHRGHYKEKGKKGKNHKD